MKNFKIKNSNDLKYTKNIYGGAYGSGDDLYPQDLTVSGIERCNENIIKIILKNKNNQQREAFIKIKKDNSNNDSQKKLNIIEQNLAKFIGRNWEFLINYEFEF